MSQVLVSVIIPVYNGEKYLQKSVESILSQYYKNIELILVDDGSNDDSKKLMKELSSKDVRIKTYYNRNGGVAFARNYGIKQAKGELIAFCDQDDLWLPAKLSKQVSLFENEKVGFVCCGAIEDHILHNKQNTLGFPANYKGDVFSKLVQLNILTCCAVVARKSCIESVGGFDDDRVLMGVDDWHLWLKLSIKYEFDYTQEALAVHIFHGDNYSRNEEKMHEAELDCLNKIEMLANQQKRVADWHLIKQQLHIRYAKSYLHFGMFKLAGDTLIKAHKASKNLKIYFKGLLLKYVPNIVWEILQKIRRGAISQKRIEVNEKFIK